MSSPASELSRDLSLFHITMMGLGMMIGAGVFLGMGISIGTDVFTLFGSVHKEPGVAKAV